MKNLNVDELKKIQLNILDIVAEFCEKNQIKYFLCGGTLIGAVRHKGYIPWDDDIDIALLRCDYEKLIDNFNGYNSLYKVYTAKNNDWFPYPFAKIAFKNSIIEEQSESMKKNIGINIDVFPIDSVPDDINEQKKLISDIKRQRDILDAKSIVINPKRAFYKNAVIYIGKLFFKFIKTDKIVNRIVKLARMHENSNFSNAGIIVWGYGLCEVVPIDVFADSVKMKFEGNEYSVPKGYKKWLSSIYGNYMDMPPEEKRISHHAFKAYLTYKNE